MFPVNPIFQPRTLMELYDLAEDPWEHHNLAAQGPTPPVQEMLVRMHQIMCDTGDPILDGPIPSRMHSQAVDALRRAGA